jgi:serine/threonine protein phosphatase 1
MASIWAIGDLHGEIGRLTALLQALPRESADTTVFIGDYIDRGPDSAGVVDRILAEYNAAPERTILLWGNHEDMAAEHFGFPRPSSFAYDPYDWYRNGGVQAMASYDYEPNSRELLAAPCPESLARLFGLLRLFWRPAIGEFPDLAHVIYVHAGVLPGEQPEESNGDTLLWVREDFLNAYDGSGRLVVHGHTPFREVRVQPDKIGIDTGAAYGGLLTALQMPERIVYQADAKGQVRSFELPDDGL